MEKLNINQWAEEDRPREKFMRLGAGALTNAELLAILIGSGSPDESAVALMQRLLADCGNRLKTLGRMSIKEMNATVKTTDPETGKKVTVRRYKGLADVKAIKILAACELGRRRMAEDALELPSIRSSADLYSYFAPRMQDLPHEECHVLLLNQANRMIDTLRLSEGGLTGTAVDIRLVLREALLRRAPAIALCHNHPSGNLRPSGEDDRLTERLRQACRTMDIRLVDHIIVGDGGYYSYCDEGRLS